MPRAVAATTHLMARVKSAKGLWLEQIEAFNATSGLTEYEHGLNNYLHTLRARLLL